MTGKRSGKGIIGEFDCHPAAQAWAERNGYWGKHVSELRRLAYDHCNPPRGKTQRFKMTDSDYNNTGYSAYGKGWLIEQLYAKFGSGSA